MINYTKPCDMKVFLKNGDTIIIRKVCRVEYLLPGYASFQDEESYALASIADDEILYFVTTDDQIEMSGKADNVGYRRCLEAKDWTPNEWTTICKLAGHLPPENTERIVISGCKMEGFLKKT